MAEDQVNQSALSDRLFTIVNSMNGMKKKTNKHNIIQWQDEAQVSST